MLAHATAAWGFQGYTTSDSDAVADAWDKHHYFKDAAIASCRALVDGKCDINSGETYSKSLLQGVASGSCTISDVDAALSRTLRVRFEMGLFDPVASAPLAELGLSDIGTPAAAELSLAAAEQSLVLLRNSGGALPMKPGGKIAVIGPLADSPTAMMGTHWKGAACPGDEKSLACVDSIAMAITTANIGGNTTVLTGSGVDSGTDADRAAAVAAAATADTVVLVLGITSAQEKEAHDRTNIDLPACQHALAAAVIDVGKPSVLVLINGGALSIDEEKKAGSTVAIIEVSKGHGGHHRNFILVLLLT